LAERRAAQAGIPAFLLLLAMEPEVLKKEVENLTVKMHG
jgi:hypothetical protein